MSDTFRWYLGGLMATAASSACCSPRPSTATSGSSPARGRRPASAGASTTARSASAVVGHGRACAGREPHPRRRRQRLPRLRATIAGGSTASATRSTAGWPTTATATRRRPARIPRPSWRRSTLWRHSAVARVLRRRRAPPRPEHGRIGMAGLQPARHRLGAPALLRAHLSPPPGGAAPHAGPAGRERRAAPTTRARRGRAPAARAAARVRPSDPPHPHHPGPIYGGAAVGPIVPLLGVGSLIRPVRPTAEKSHLLRERGRSSRRRLVAEPDPLLRLRAAVRDVRRRGSLHLPVGDVARGVRRFRPGGDRCALPRPRARPAVRLEEGRAAMGVDGDGGR